MKYILASKSPRRAELLKFLIDDFIICPSNFDEDSINIDNPKELLETLSFKKADYIKDKYPNYLIIDCDTVVVSNNENLDYIKTKEPFDKASGYGIQVKGSLFV